MGAGLKASIAWCENSIAMAPGPNFSGNAFHLLSRTSGDDPIQRVDGPISRTMEVYNSENTELWNEGASELSTDSSGTRVHLTAARVDFDDDVAKASSKMSMKADYVALVLGVRFRRLLGAHEENSITITYRDINDEETVTSEGTIAVPPVDPIFKDAVESAPDDMAEYDSFDDFEAAVAELEIPGDTKYGFDTTTITDDLGVEYNVSYEFGEIDLKAMGDAVDADDRNFTVTTEGSDNFRFRYSNSTKDEGVDVYANGRVLNLNEWPFDIDRHQTLTRFNGVIRIEPTTTDQEVPTNNEKTGIDKTSSLWQKLVEWLNDSSRKPQRKTYKGDDDDDDVDVTTGDDDEEGDTDDGGDDRDSDVTTDDDDDGDDVITTGDDEDDSDNGDDDDGDGDVTTDDDDDGDEVITTGDDDEGDSSNGDDDDDDSERTAVDELVNQLEESVTEEDMLRYETEIAGGEIDIIYEQADGSTNLYKIVYGEARPQDIYEMMMYQDHFKKFGDGDYGKTILIATRLTDDAQADYDSITARTDTDDDQYEFDTVTQETAAESYPWITD